MMGGPPVLRGAAGTPPNRQKAAAPSFAGPEKVWIMTDPLPAGLFIPIVGQMSHPGKHSARHQAFCCPPAGRQQQPGYLFLAG